MGFVLISIHYMIILNYLEFFGTFKLFYLPKQTAHHQLRDEINNVVRFNKTTTDSGQFGQAIAEAKSDLSSYKEISENIIRNLREQVTFLTNVGSMPF